MDPSSPFLPEKAAQAAELMRLLSNEHRLLALCLLLEHREMSVSALLAHMPIGQSALSQHLAKLRAANVVVYRREAQVLLYRIHHPGVGQIIATLKSIYCP